MDLFRSWAFWTYILIRHLCNSAKGFEAILKSLSWWLLIIDNTKAKPPFDCFRFDTRQTRLFPCLQYTAVHLYKRPTLGTQYGRKLLNSTNRRWELKIDDLLFVFRLPTLREQRESACPTFLTLPNGKILAFCHLSQHCVWDIIN